MTSTIRLRARQRDLLHRHRAFSLFDAQAIAQFDREVLEVLAGSFTAGAAITAEFQHIANAAMARATAADKLPARATKGRPASRVSDDPKKMKSVLLYLEEVRQNELRKKRGDCGATNKDEIAERVAERAGMSARNLKRLVKEARDEARIPAADTASVQPEEVAADLGLARAHLPAPGTQWELIVHDHGAVNKASTGTGDDIPLLPWPPYSQGD